MPLISPIQNSRFPTELYDIATGYGFSGVGSLSSVFLTSGIKAPMGMPVELSEGLPCQNIPYCTVPGGSPEFQRHTLIEGAFMPLLGK